MSNPPLSAFQPPPEETGVPPRKEGEPYRPVGIRILSFLFVAPPLIGMAGLLVFVGIGAFGKERLFSSFFEALGTPLSVLILVFLVALLPLSLAAGIGMWRAEAWGWWIGTSIWAYNLVRNAYALYVLQVQVGGFEGLEHGPGYYYAKFGFRIGLSVLALLYLFRRKTLDYFSMQDANRLKLLANISWICITVVGLLNLLVYLIS